MKDFEVVVTAGNSYIETVDDQYRVQYTIIDGVPVKESKRFNSLPDAIEELRDWTGIDPELY